MADACSVGYACQGARGKVSRDKFSPPVRQKLKIIMVLKIFMNDYPVRFARSIVNVNRISA